jgi:hypothetical protein
MSLIPGSATPSGVGDALLDDLTIVIGLAPTAARELAGQPYLQKLQITQRWVKLIKEAPADADAILDPETGIELPNFKKVIR